MINFTKTHIRVVNTWVRIGNQETLLIVNENSEIILNRYDDGYVNICKSGYISNVYISNWLW